MIEITEDMIEDGEDNALLSEGVEELVELAKKDYKEWSDMGSRRNEMKGRESNSYNRIKNEMIDKYNHDISWKMGFKYIKIITGSSVWGFVVNRHDDKKFRFGDILKAAGWKAPARNFARGNVVDRDFKGVRWTGAL